MKRPRSTAFLAWLGLLVALAASTPLTARAQTASGTLAAEAPVAAGKGVQVTALIAGAAHTCALFSDKTMRCWGDNQYGELGDNSTVPSPRPVAVQGLPGAPTVTFTRAVHNCSLMGDGTVECWGMNKYGQLGDGTLTNSDHPLVVKQLTQSVRLLAVGGDHVCVTYQDDTTWCWGQNKYGELGDGQLTPGSRQAVEVKGLPSPPAQMIAGVWHTCAILKDSSTWCWGHNEEGELGNGTTGIGSPTPVRVKGLPATPTQLAAGNFHTCALEPDGSTWCWGEGKYGQLGNGSIQFSTTPKPVTGLESNPTHLVAGGYHTCATFADGTMWCWGQNNFGQLGNGTTTNETRPVQVKGFRPNPTLVTGGGLHTCVAYADATIDCWGLNAVGQGGNGTNRPIVTQPTPVIGLPVATLAHTTAHKQKSSASSGTSAGEIAGIGLPVLAVAGFVAFMAVRRRGA